MLAKEDEGRVGALGVATSLGQVKGLVMDLGGGSTQLTWLLSDSKGIKMPDQGAVSMPFGAAALSRRLSEAEAKGSAARRELADDIQQRITEAFESLHVPAELSELANNEGGYALYLSGGGFRGWGAILMSQHRVCPYPIPVINGFSAPRADFLDTDAISAAVSELDSDQDEEAIFRVSQRRANQVPAVAFLVTALSRALPQIKEVRFCQGGVREGFLFSKLDGQIRKQSPVVVATAPLSSPCSAHYATLLFSSIPHETRSEMLPTPDIMTAFSNLSAHFSTHPKDVRAAAALRSTTTGILASAHGLSHHERALLALLLCERWGGKKHLPPTDLAFFQAMQALVGREHTWWTGYLGRVAALIGAFYPSGKGSHDLVLQSRWQITKKGEEMLVLCVADCKGESVNGLVGEEMERIEKVGKKKNWCGGREGYGFKVLVQ
jgi:retrograde regulation protein 2